MTPPGFAALPKYAAAYVSAAIAAPIVRRAAAIGPRPYMDPGSLKSGMCFISRDVKMREKVPSGFFIL